MGLQVSISTISRAVRALGFRVKKVGLSAAEKERPRCAGKTYQVERARAGGRSPEWSNCIHHVKGVEKTLQAAGMIPLCLPPYSPDLNPIEMMWSKMKAILRRFGCSIAALLPQMVANALALVSHADCIGWFFADGYWTGFPRSAINYRSLFSDARRGAHFGGTHRRIHAYSFR